MTDGQRLEAPATHTGMMVALARMGFDVVPRYVRHGEKGPGILYMDGEGLRFEPFDANHSPDSLTWDEFDRLPA